MADEEKKIADVDPEAADGGKRRKKRSWRRRLLHILIGVIAVLVLLVIFRDFAIKHTVEKAGSLVVGTPIVCGHFSSSLSGKVHIRDLTVGNPEGYHNPYAFKLGEVKVDLDVGTLFSEKIEVRDVYVEGVSVDYEIKFGRSNLGEIQKNLERFTPADKDNPDSANEDGDDAQSQQAVIRHLKIANTSLSFSSEMLKSTMKMPLPGLELENLGDGKPIGETLNEFFGLIFTSINKAVTGAGGVVVDAVGGAGGVVVDAVGGAVTGIGDVISNTVKTVTGK